LAGQFQRSMESGDVRKEVRDAIGLVALKPTREPVIQT
jgi:hypothetical protein